MPCLRTRDQKTDEPLVIGWREKVSLPELGIGTFVAKIDTGARSAALHATDIRVEGHHVKFTVPLKGRNHHCTLPLKDRRRVKSSSGHSQTRAVVETTVKIGRHVLSIDVTLTDRTDMGVAMLLGRASLDGRFLVHPVRTQILSAKKRKAP
jgi:ribosomal protein S6--L-glutamate ligase